MNELKALYETLGVTDYNIEYYKAVLTDLQERRNGLLSEIQKAISLQKPSDDTAD